MKDRSILPMLSGNDAEDTFHRAIHRINRDSTIPKSKQTLGTKYPADFISEPSQPPFFQDELSDHHVAVNRDWSVFKFILWIAGIVIACGLIRWAAWVLE